MNKLIYNIVDTRTGEYVKTNCEMIAIIPADKILTDQEVKDYFGIDSSHPNFKNVKHSKLRRFVFDKCVIPDSPYFKLEEVFE